MKDKSKKATTALIVVAALGVLFSICLFFFAPAHMSRIGLTRDTYIVIAIMFSLVPELYADAKSWKDKDMSKTQKVGFMCDVLTIIFGIIAIATAVTNSAVALSLANEPPTPDALYFVVQALFVVTNLLHGVAMRKNREESKT